LASGRDRRQPGFPRNNPETKFYSREKLVKNLKAITDAVAVR
jgi:hypothetical protein